MMELQASTICSVHSAGCRTPANVDMVLLGLVSCLSEGLKIPLAKDAHLTNKAIQIHVFFGGLKAVVFASMI